jgi:hypothetical protein
LCFGTTCTITTLQPTLHLYKTPVSHMPFGRDLVSAGNRILVSQLEAVFSSNWNTERCRVSRSKHLGYLCELEHDECGQSMVQSLPIDVVVLRLTERRSANWAAHPRNPQPLAPQQFGELVTRSTGKWTRELYRVIRNDCWGFNNLSYTIHLR